MEPIFHFYLHFIPFTAGILIVNSFEFLMKQKFKIIHAPLANTVIVLVQICSKSG